MTVPKPLSPDELWALRQIGIHELNASNAHEFVYVLRSVKGDLVIRIDSYGNPYWTNNLQLALRVTVDNIRNSVGWRRHAESRFYAIGRLIPLEDDNG